MELEIHQELYSEGEGPQTRETEMMIKMIGDNQVVT